MTGPLQAGAFSCIAGKVFTQRQAKEILTLCEQIDENEAMKNEKVRDQLVSFVEDAKEMMKEACTISQDILAAWGAAAEILNQWDQ